ncbi:transmembrane protein [Ceratobasidium sp. AG-Ba]|nr:transmembrane protein [Ceratobasidium sp. AG-Ba]
MVCGQSILLLALGWASFVAGQGPTVVRIDDSFAYNPTSNLGGIQYSHRFSPYDWSSVTTGDPNQRYNNTYTQSQTWRSQLYFAFRGSSIAYYGDKPPGTGSLVLALDGQPNTNVTWTNTGTTTQYQQLLWSAGGLDSGDHSLVIGNSDQNNRSIGLDYLAITPWEGTDITPQRTGPGASPVSPHAVVVDNENNGVLYSGSAWEPYITGADGKNQHMYFNDTEHCSTTPGASLSYTFNGTALWYFAEDYSASGRIKFTIDGGNEQYTSAAGTGDYWTSQRLVWNITGLTPAPHTVTLTHVGNPNEWACFDFFMYLPSSVSAATSSSTPTSTPASSNSSKSTPVGAIAGGVVGGLALIAFLIGVAFIYRRRQYRPPSETVHHEVYTGDMAYPIKQVDPPYTDHTFPPSPAPAFDQRPYSPYANVPLHGGSSISPTVWTGTTYAGHPEPQ